MPNDQESHNSRSRSVKRKHKTKDKEVGYDEPASLSFLDLADSSQIESIKGSLDSTDSISSSIKSTNTLSPTFPDSTDQSASSSSTTTNPSHPSIRIESILNESKIHRPSSDCRMKTFTKSATVRGSCTISSLLEEPIISSHSSSSARSKRTKPGSHGKKTKNSHQTSANDETTLIDSTKIETQSDVSNSSEDVASSHDLFSVAKSQLPIFKGQQRSRCKSIEIKNTIDSSCINLERSSKSPHFAPSSNTSKESVGYESYLESSNDHIRSSSPSSTTTNKPSLTIKSSNSNTFEKNQIPLVSEGQMASNKENIPSSSPKRTRRTNKSNTVTSLDNNRAHLHLNPNHSIDDGNQQVVSDQQIVEGKDSDSMESSLSQETTPIKNISPRSPIFSKASSMMMGEEKGNNMVNHTNTDSTRLDSDSTSTLTTTKSVMENISLPEPHVRYYFLPPIQPIT